MECDKIMSRLLNRCNTKLTQSIVTKDDKNAKLYTTIHSILQTPRPFENLYVSVSLNILTDLGYSPSYAKKIYAKLIK